MATVQNTTVYDVSERPIRQRSQDGRLPAAGRRRDGGRRIRLERKTMTPVKTVLAAFGLLVTSALISAYVVAGVAPVVPEVARFVLGIASVAAAVFIAQQIKHSDDESFYLGIAVIGALGGTFIAL